MILPMDLSGTMLGPKGYIEWQYWKDIAKELKSLGIDLNHEDNLTEAIRAWGWKFHEFQRDLGK